MAFIYTDRQGTHRCRRCGKPKQSKPNKGKNSPFCDACMQLENAIAKSKKK